MTVSNPCMVIYQVVNIYNVQSICSGTYMPDYSQSIMNNKDAVNRDISHNLTHLLLLSKTLFPLPIMM